MKKLIGFFVIAISSLHMSTANATTLQCFTSGFFGGKDVRGEIRNVDTAGKSRKDLENLCNSHFPKCKHDCGFEFK